MRPDSRTRLCYRLRCHTERKGEHRSLSERDYIGLIDEIAQLVKAPMWWSGTGSTPMSPTLCVT